MFLTNYLSLFLKLLNFNFMSLNYLSQRFLLYILNLLQMQLHLIDIRQHAIHKELL
jgi:hypothetical protein